MTEWNTTQAVLEEIDYPDSDGEPMAETDFQRIWLIYLINVLDTYFAQQQDVYVSGDLLIYYVEGDKRFSVAPDVFVVFGIEKKLRRNYLLWKEGKAPDVVIEIASPTTYKRDEQEKPDLYRDLGVREYFQYDPVGEYLFPSLQGRRLNAAGEYEPIVPQSQNGYLVLVSEVLGLELHQDALRLRVYDPVNREYLRSHKESETAYGRSEEARRRAEEERQQEREARQRAEDQIKALEEELRRMREQGQK